MRIFAIGLALCVSLCSCVSYAPPKLAPLNRSATLQEFSGEFKNVGQRDPRSKGMRPIFLATLFWPEKTLAENGEVDAIELLVVDDDNLRVVAIKRDGSVDERVLTRGENFEFEGSSIRLPTRWGVPLPIVGAGCRSTRLNMAADGSLVYADRTSAAGLLAAMFPFALSVEESVRFERLKSL